MATTIDRDCVALSGRLPVSFRLDAIMPETDAIRIMPKRSSTPPKRLDFDQPAKPIVGEATGGTPLETVPIPPEDGKNPAAVALGRLGGLKGGKARAAKLTAKKRSEIAKKAAAARWGKSKG